MSGHRKWPPPFNSLVAQYNHVLYHGIEATAPNRAASNLMY